MQGAVLSGGSLISILGDWQDPFSERRRAERKISPLRQSLLAFASLAALNASLF